MRSAFSGLLLLCCFGCNEASARQKKTPAAKVDTAYISEHEHDLTTRLYGSRKFTKYELVDHNTGSHITYRPNDPFNIGVGANYKFIGVNIGFNTPFVNQNKDKYGATHFLDLQTHAYLRKVVIDVYAQRYKGFYLDNPDVLRSYAGATEYPYRPDLRTTTLGATAQYIFNSRKFSLRAPYLQNEFQKRSAGSFLLGAGLYADLFHADSGIIPNNLYDAQFWNGRSFNRSNIYSLVANGGYGYTLVIRHHFFATLAATGGLGANYTTLHGPEGFNSSHIGLQVNTDVRFAVGYNSENWFAGIHFLNHTGRSVASYSGDWQYSDNGMFRVSVARRFKVKHILGSF